MRTSAIERLKHFALNRGFDGFGLRLFRVGLSQNRNDWGVTSGKTQILSKRSPREIRLFNHSWNSCRAGHSHLLPIDLWTYEHAEILHNQVPLPVFVDEETCRPIRSYMYAKGIVGDGEAQGLVCGFFARDGNDLGSQRQ